MRRRALGRYRSHRKAAWAALVLASVGLVAAISIPLALAAGTASAKYYTLGLQPATVCSAATNTATTTVTLTNTAGSQTLGSAQIYFPAGSVFSVSPSAWSFAPNQSNSLYFSGTKDVVSATYLGL